MSEVVGDSVSGLGTERVLAGTAAGYNATMSTATHQGDGTFGFLSLSTLNLHDGSTLTASRHFGLMCDSYGNVGWHRLLTADSGDSRFMHDGGSPQRSLSRIR